MFALRYQLISGLLLSHHFYKKNGGTTIPNRRWDKIIPWDILAYAIPHTAYQYVLGEGSPIPPRTFPGGNTKRSMIWSLHIIGLSQFISQQFKISVTYIFRRSLQNPHNRLLKDSILFQQCHITKPMLENNQNAIQRTICQFS